MKQIRVRGPRDALVRIVARGICDTDVSFVHRGGITGKPMPLGHEMAGVVEWVGAEVQDASVGDRVIVHPADDTRPRLGTGATEGGLTPVLLVREAAKGRRLFRVPDGVPLHVAAPAEPLAVGMQAVNQADVAPGDKVAVFGCGPVGLMSLATLADRGVEDVVAIDLGARRRELARQMGAAHVLDPGACDVWKKLARVHGTTPFLFGPTPATGAFTEASGSDRVLGEILGRGRFDGRMSVVALH